MDSIRKVGFGLFFALLISCSSPPNKIITNNNNSIETEFINGSSGVNNNGENNSSEDLVNVEGLPISSQTEDEESRVVSLVSDEQDFEAVSDRESIESDAIRRLEQRTVRVVYNPVPLPVRQRNANVPAYALSSSNPVGNKIYNRLILFDSNSAFTRRCAQHKSDFIAQQVFLNNGGPNVDRLLLDPDGDGYACGWTPDIFQDMVQ